MFRRGKRDRDALGMLRISERAMDVDAAMCPCCKDWQKAFEHVKLMLILQDTGDGWRGRRLVSKLYT